jgi:hypothetical protein
VLSLKLFPKLLPELQLKKKWFGHGSEEMIRRYTHLRPDFMRDEQARILPQKNMENC